MEIELSKLVVKQANGVEVTLVDTSMIFYHYLSCPTCINRREKGIYLTLNTDNTSNFLMEIAQRKRNQNSKIYFISEKAFQQQTGLKLIDISTAVHIKVGS
jgi:hypothetical protein